MRDAGFYTLLYQGAKEHGQLVVFVYAQAAFCKILFTHSSDCPTCLKISSYIIALLCWEASRSN